jgi:hypothetical protein
LADRYEHEAVSQLQDQDVIFFDPDNGIEVASTRNSNKHKYVSYQLLKRFWDLEKSLIIYQHGSWVKGQLDEKIETLYKLTGSDANIITVKKARVTFICVIHKHFILKDMLADFRYKNRDYKVESWRGTGGIG